MTRLEREMDRSSSFSVLWHRKGLTSVLLILTLLGAAGAGVKLPWTYNASITEDLLNSKQSSAALGGGNPYLSFDSAMVDMANLLALKVANDANTLALQQEGYTASFQAQVLSENPETEEPFIQISVKGRSKEAVVRTLQGVSASLSALLTQVQAGVPAKSRLSVQTIAEISTPMPSLSAKIKPIAGLLAVGLVLTFLIPQAVEGSVTRRRKIRAKAEQEVTGTADDRQQVPDQQVEGDFLGQRVSPMSQGGGVHSPSEYGVLGLDVLGLDQGHYS
jgi:hypothetical protein